MIQDTRRSRERGEEGKSEKRREANRSEGRNNESVMTMLSQVYGKQWSSKTMANLLPVWWCGRWSGALAILIVCLEWARRYSWHKGKAMDRGRPAEGWPEEQWGVELSRVRERKMIIGSGRVRDNVEWKNFCLKLLHVALGLCKRCACACSNYYRI